MRSAPGAVKDGLSVLRLANEAVALRAVVAPHARPEFSGLVVALLSEFGARSFGRLLLAAGRAGAERDGQHEEQSARDSHCDFPDRTRSRCARVRFTQRPSMRKLSAPSSSTRRDPRTLTR